MSKIVKIFFILTALISAPVAEALSQCAMCRATIENNVSNGEIGIGASLNFGILYLFVMPYLLIGTVAFLWYKHSKSDERKLQHKRNISKQMSQM